MLTQRLKYYASRLKREKEREKERLKERGTYDRWNQEKRFNRVHVGNRKKSEPSESKNERKKERKKKRERKIWTDRK